MDPGNSRNRRVCFDLTASKKLLIPSYTEFTAEEIENSWYTRDEYKRIDAKNQVLQRLLKSGRSVKDHKDYCFRGIQSEEAKLRRAEYRQQAMESLFWEQKRQYMAGITNEEKIRTVLLLCTKQGKDEAVARAEQDRRAAFGLPTQCPTAKRSAPMPSLSSATVLNSSKGSMLPHTANACSNSELVSLLDDALSLLDDPITA